jgi:hypothetical protein
MSQFAMARAGVPVLIDCRTATTNKAAITSSFGTLTTIAEGLGSRLRGGFASGPWRRRA